MKEVLYQNDNARVVVGHGAAIDVAWWTTDKTVEKDHIRDCIWCGHSLPEPEPRLCFQLALQDAGEPLAVEPNLCVAHSFSLFNTLKNHDPSDGATTFKTSDGSLAWGSYKTTSIYARPVPCFWCDEPIDPESTLYDIARGGATICIHEDCCSPMCTKLLTAMNNAVGEHADILVPHVL